MFEGSLYKLQCVVVLFTYCFDTLLLVYICVEACYVHRHKERIIFHCGFLNKICEICRVFCRPLRLRYWLRQCINKRCLFFSVGPSHPVGGAVASWLLRLTPELAVRVRAHGRGHCVVFLGKTLYSHGASLHPGV